MVARTTAGAQPLPLGKPPYFRQGVKHRRRGGYRGEVGQAVIPNAPAPSWRRGSYSWGHFQSDTDQLRHRRKGGADAGYSQRYRWLSESARILQ